MGFSFGKMDARAWQYVFDNGLLRTNRKFCVRVDPTDKRCIYNQFGIAAREAAEFQFYTSAGIRRDTPIELNGSIYIPAVVLIQNNKLYSRALCGKANRLRFKTNMKRTVTGENNKVTLAADSNAEFDGFLCEKYVTAAGGEVHQTVTGTYIIMAPKCITLRAGTTVRQGSDVYIIASAHYSDDCYNEYEVRLETDV